jgi:outer membrane immunogenic protein
MPCCRSLLAALAVSGLFSSAATAADLDWQGCYVGIHAGAGHAKTGFTNTADTTDFGHLGPGDSFGYGFSGTIGGGQVGCNRRIDQWVVGVEGTLAGASIKGNAQDLAILNDDVFTTKISSVATFTGRVGYAWNDLLLYAKGGYAGANVRFSVSDTVSAGGSPVGSGSQTHWQNGWTIGGGMEYAINPTWIVGLEYAYLNLRSANYDVGGGSGSYAFDVKNRSQQVLARVSYRFGP